MLKKGDVVVMHTCSEAEMYEGKLWICKTDEYTNGEGVYKQNVVSLEGMTSCFLTKYLQKVNFDFSYKEYLDKQSVYEQLIYENADLIHFKKSAEKVLTEYQLLDIEDEMNNIPECI